MNSERYDISVVIPLFNEENNVAILNKRLKGVLDNLKLSYELVFIDDGSTDKTFNKLLELHKEDSHIKIIRLRKNFGQTAALAAGFDYAKGEKIISMDGDLQHSPEDIPAFLKKLDEGFDIVSGWRKQRIDNFFFRRLPSKIANFLMAKLSGVSIHDFGTTFKAYRSEVIKELKLYGDFHRFIPALAKQIGASIVEIPIQNTLRKKGRSNYGILRTITVFFDLIRIKFFLAYLSRPLQIFGGIGIIFSIIGFCIASYLVYLKYAFGLSLLAYRGPLFLLSIFFILIGVQLFMMGLLGEIIVKFYHESRSGTVYLVREIIG